MYASLDNVKMDMGYKARETIMAHTRRFTTKRGIVGPQDWYMKEFSRETMAYFKSKEVPNQMMTQTSDEEKAQIIKEHADEYENMLMLDKSVDKSVVRGITEALKQSKENSSDAIEEEDDDDIEDERVETEAVFLPQNSEVDSELCLKDSSDEIHRKSGVQVQSDHGSQKVKRVKQRKQVLEQFTMLQDQAEIPTVNEVLDWRYFNTDFYSHDREFSEVAEICKDNIDKLIDIRPYIIDTPFLAQSTDRLQKILEVFRHMHLRTLPVTNPGTGALEGVITRQDLFAYMSL